MERSQQASNSSAKSARWDFFYVLFVFLACALVGWVFETVEMSIINHRFCARGYLFVLKPIAYYFTSLQHISFFRHWPLILGLPLIEVYGFGGIIAVFGFHRLAKRPIRLFFTGMAVLTLFELLGSYFCSYVLHKSFWDYSGRFLNFQGRICLMSSLAWGVGAVLAVKGLKPITDRLYSEVKNRRQFRIIVILLMIGAVICAMAKYWWFADALA